MYISYTLFYLVIKVTSSGVPIHNSCLYWNIAVLFATGILVNGPYALITTAVSAELGKLHMDVFTHTSLL